MTTFITKDGPDIGTIWFDRDKKTRPPMIVKSVDPTDDKRLGGEVDFEGYDWESFDVFMHYVEIGRYVLIGCTPPNLMYTCIR
jgi:hypothetical protein